MRTHVVAWLLIVVCEGIPSLGAQNPEPSLQVVQELTSRNFQNIKSLVMDYTYTDSSGNQSKVALKTKNGMFRVDRIDLLTTTPPKIKVGPKEKEKDIKVPTNPLSHTITAFNGQRSQQFDRNERILTLCDGVDKTSYTVPNPLSKVYGWAFTGGKSKHRIDELTNPTPWQLCFSKATRVATTTENGVDVDVIDFPQTGQVQLPCYFRVTFAVSLGYMPLHIERYIKEGDRLASSLRVEKHKMFDVDGTPLAIPTLVSFEQNGADRVSMAMTVKYVVDEETLKINQPIADSIFTITGMPADKVLDSDLMARQFRAANDLVPVTANPRMDHATSNWVATLVTAAGILLVAAYFLYRRQALKDG